MVNCGGGSASIRSPPKNTSGRRRAHSVTAADVRQFIAVRQRQNASPATINRELAVLRRAFRLEIEAESIHRMPKIRTLLENNVRAGLPRPRKAKRGAQVSARRSGPRYRDTSLLVRVPLGEPLALKARQVDVMAHAIIPEPGRTKGGEGRTVFLEGEAWAVVAKWHRRRATGHVLARTLFHRGGVPVRSIRGS